MAATPDANGGIIYLLMQVPYEATVRLMLTSLERNLLPDPVVRRLTRILLASRLRSHYKTSAYLQLSDMLEFAHSLREMPIAIKTEMPKDQHYEVPTSFFKLVLGKHLKYSCCFFPDKSSSLEDAEKAMLELYSERSQLKDGLTVLDVGCGWGSLSLYIAQKYPNCQVTGICNSTTQKAYIEEKCRYFPYSFFDHPDPMGRQILHKGVKSFFPLTERIFFDIRRMEDKIKFKAQNVVVYHGLMFNALIFFFHVISQTKIRISLTTITFYHRELQLQNVDIIVADISTFDMEASYDRIFSIEMFEHMKNYQDLLKKISKWMNSDSLLFIHYFCHKTFAYHFEDINEDDWITRYFFTGGTMPSANLLLYFQDDVSIVNQWLVNGKHYARTSEEWLKRMDQNSISIKPILESTYGKDSAVKWTAYWRTFFIAVAELFGYNDGEEWMVTHFLFKKK